MAHFHSNMLCDCARTPRFAVLSELSAIRDRAISASWSWGIPRGYPLSAS
jgi:hypothetical protein